MKYRRIVSKLLQRSEEKSVLLHTAMKVYAYKRAKKSARAKSLAAETSPLTASLLINHLSFDPRSATIPVLDLAGPIRRFARSDDPDLARYCTYLMLTELGLIPKRPGASGGLLLRHLGVRVKTKKIRLLPGFFTDLFNLKMKVNWDQVLGKKAHSEAQRRSNLIRGAWKGNPSFLITVLDNFNDLLIQKLSNEAPATKGSFQEGVWVEQDSRFWKLASTS